MLIPFTQCIQVFGKPFKGVLHIGAHLGEEGIEYANNGVKYVVWIEGNKTLMRFLFEATRTLPIRQGYFCEVLSDTNNEKVEFNITNNSQSSSILPLGTHKIHYPNIHVVEKKEVNTVTFKEFYKKNIIKIDMDLIDLINLDVQGAELKVLKGFDDLLERFRNIKGIYSEINFEEVYQGASLVEEIDDYLKKYGFNRVLTKTTPYGWGDAFYLRHN